MKLKRVCIFCGSSYGFKPDYEKAAREMGVTLAKRNIGLVYGGGRVGLMGAVADAALAAGGEVIGVIPKPLATKELAHAALTKLHVVKTMHERKALMADLSDAFIALPGGYGTLEEFCEVLTWAQLGLHLKPCALLDTRGYFDPLLKLFDHSVTEGFVKPGHRRLVLTGKTPARLLSLLSKWKPQKLEKWISRRSS